MIKLLILTSVLFAFTAVQADARKASHKPPPAKCQPYGDGDPPMCGTMSR